MGGKQLMQQQRELREGKQAWSIRVRILQLKQAWSIRVGTSFCSEIACARNALFVAGVEHVSPTH